MSPALAPTADGPRPDARPEVQGDSAALEWLFNPWRQATLRAVLGTIAFSLILASIALLRLPFLAAGVLTVVLTVDFAQVMFPARCRVDGEGVARRLLFTWERRPWGRIRIARIGQRGLFVSTSARPALASFHGMLLPIPSAAPPALATELRRRLAQHGL